MQATTMPNNDNNNSLHEDEEEQLSQRFSGSPSSQSQPAASSSSSSVQPEAKAALAVASLLAMTTLLATATTMGTGKGFSATSSALSPVGRSLTRKGAGSSGYELDHNEESSNPELIDPELEFMKRSKGKSSRHMNGISGSNINAYTVPTGGEAIFNDVVFDASNILSQSNDTTGWEISSFGLSLQKSSEATICSAKWIKGGLEEYDDWGVFKIEIGAAAVHVDEGSSLDIVEGNIEGGESWENPGPGLKVEKEAKVRIGPGRHVKIRGGNGARGDAVRVYGGHLEVFGGEFGDKKSPFGNLLRVGSSNSTVNIYGGKWHPYQRNNYSDVYAGNEFTVYYAGVNASQPDSWPKVNIYGENLQKIPMHGKYCKDYGDDCFYRIWGTLSDGNKIDIIGTVFSSQNESQRDAVYNIINSDETLNPPDFSDVC